MNPKYIELSEINRDNRDDIYLWKMLGQNHQHYKTIKEVTYERMMQRRDLIKAKEEK